MNILLLRTEDMQPDGTARLVGRRLAHARGVLRSQPGDSLRVGLFEGQLGSAKVLRISQDELVLLPAFTDPPPARAGVDLLLAMPRPKALRRLLPALASLGVDRVVLLNAARVEKSFFGAGVLEQEIVDALFAEGLEQARDTRPPQLLVRDRFRPFVEDELPALATGSQALVAHPDAARLPAALPQRAGRRLLLAIGPEGGWIPFELELLARQGFEAVTLGPRTLRVEVAVPLLLGALTVFAR